MDPISRNLQVTQQLLNSLEQDPTLLDDPEFIKKLSILRLKHEETTHFLASQVEESVSTTSPVHCKSSHYICEGTSHGKTKTKSSRDNSRSFSSNYQSTNTSKSILNRQSSQGSTSTVIHRPIGSFATSSHVVEESYYDDGISTTRDVPTIVDEIVDIPRIDKHSKRLKKKTKSMPTVANIVPVVAPPKNENFTPKVTVPRPFQLSMRRSIENTYAKKFMQQMIEEKKREEINSSEEMKKQKFKAKPVPETTYHPHNNYLNDQKYISTMRRKVAAAAKRKFEQQNQLVRSKSESHLENLKPIGYIPPSTYISPIPVRENARSRSATRRAAQMIHEARTPKGIKSHQASSALAFSLRHDRCKLERPQTEMRRRASPPDFQLIHAKMDHEIRRLSPKPTTVVMPFKFQSRSPSASSRHRNCGEKEIDKYTPSRRSFSNGRNRSTAIPTTYAAQLREELNRAKLEKEREEKEKSNENWKDDNRKRISAFLGSRSRTEEDIAIRTKQKLQQQQETTNEYMKQLAEMKQRVLNGPLIMEKQSALAQEHRLQRKFENRMNSAKKASAIIVKEHSNRESSNFRRGSQGSAGTFVVESSLKNGEDEYEDDFEKSNSSSASSSSSTSSNSKSSSSRSNAS